MENTQITELNSAQLLAELNSLRVKAIDLGKEWAEANKRFKDLRELMPSFLAVIQVKQMAKVKINEARIMALSSKEYQDKVKEMNQAEEVSELLYVAYRGYMASIDALTSISYVRNNEIKMETGASSRFQR